MESFGTSTPQVDKKRKRFSYKKLAQERKKLFLERKNQMMEEVYRSNFVERWKRKQS